MKKKFEYKKLPIDIRYSSIDNAISTLIEVKKQLEEQGCEDINIEIGVDYYGDWTEQAIGKRYETHEEYAARLEKERQEKEQKELRFKEQFIIS